MISNTKGKSLNKVLLLVLLGIFAAGLGYVFSITGTKSYTVLLKDNTFDPQAITIHKGDNIVFKNVGKNPHWPASDFHPTHGIYPEFDPTHGIAAGEEWKFKFEKIGKWRFHDHLNPETKGSVTVLGN